MVRPGVEEVELAPCTHQWAERLVQQILRGCLNLGEAGITTDRTCAGQAQLEAVVLRRIVRSREHGSGRIEMARGEVQEVGGCQAQVGHVDAF